MTTIAEGTTLIDLMYLGEPGHIAIPVIDTRGGLVLVDCGPTTTLEALHAGLAQLGATFRDVSTLLVTHIHLDHSGAAGVLAEENPALEICVHERGAPHLIDPTRLLRSATMLYGDEMERLWGEVRPVPEDSIRILSGGEKLPSGDRSFRTAYTPGHAWHHLSYFDERTGFAYTGDVVGEQHPGSNVPIPVTPPPDIEVDEMVASGHRILDWGPERLFVTHFATVESPPEFIAEHEKRLLDWSGMVRASLDEGGSDEVRAERFADQAMPELEDALRGPAAAFLRRDILTGNWVGLARYWRKKLERET